MTRAYRNVEGTESVYQLRNLKHDETLLLQVQFVSVNMFVDVSQETANILLLIIACINVCIMTPIQIYFMYRFWQYKEKKISFFTKRHPSLVMFNCIVFNLYPLLIRPVVDYLRLNQHIDTFC